MSDFFPGWFPRLSPDGRGLLCGITDQHGATGVFWNKVKLDTPLPLSKCGWLSNDTVVATDGFTLLSFTSPLEPHVVGPVIANELTAGGRFVAWFSAIPPQVMGTWMGQPIRDVCSPALDDNGMLSYFTPYQSVDRTLLHGVQPIWQGPGDNLRARHKMLGWTANQRPWFYGGTVAVQVSDRPTFSCTPVLIDGQQWVLASEAERLVLYRVSGISNVGYLVYGVFDNALSCDARGLSNGIVRVVLSYDGGKLFDTLVDTHAPMVNLDTEPSWHVEPFTEPKLIGMFKASRQDIFYHRLPVNVEILDVRGQDGEETGTGEICDARPETSVRPVLARFAGGGVREQTVRRLAALPHDAPRIVWCEDEWNAVFAMDAEIYGIQIWPGWHSPRESAEQIMAHCAPRFDEAARRTTKPLVIILRQSDGRQRATDPPFYSFDLRALFRAAVPLLRRSQVKGLLVFSW